MNTTNTINDIDSIKKNKSKTSYLLYKLGGERISEAFHSAQRNTEETNVSKK